MSWHSGFEPICRADVPLREHTWYKLGGPARWLVEPRSEDELAAVMLRIRDAGVPWRVLGRGANLLVRDAGFDGAVIRLSCEAFDRIEAVTESSGSIYAGAGYDFPKLIRASISRELVGMEKLAGIPGTLGGVIRMNAGGKYGEVREFVHSVRALDRDGTLTTRLAAECGFRYRGSDFAGCIVVGATLTMPPGDPAAAMQRHKEIWNEKYNSQPPVSQRSAGCIFKNPPGNSAGRLLDQSGLKGVRVGGAEISHKHANFIVANDGATSQDVIDLIEVAKQRVHAATGIELHAEVEIW